MPKVKKSPPKMSGKPSPTMPTKRKGRGVKAGQFVTPPRKPSTSRQSRSPATNTTSTPQSSSTISTKSSSKSKRNVSKMGALSIQDSTPKAKKQKTPKRKKQQKPQKPQKKTQHGKKNKARKEQGMKPNLIDWLTPEGVLSGCKACLEKSSYADKDDRERIIMLAKQFAPTDMRPVYFCIAMEAGLKMKDLNLDTVRRIDALAQELADIIITYRNANETVAVPSKITVK